MVYGLLRALPGDRAFLPPSPLRSVLLKSLMPASGHQDHTASPSASRAIRQRRIRVHRIPPRVRDDREPPLLVGRDGGGYKTDLGAAASIISENQKFVCGRPEHVGLRGYEMTDATLPTSRLRRMSQMLAQPGHAAVVASFRLSGPQQT
jgi:hypothetical protein